MNKEINFKNVLIVFIILILILANLIVLLKMNELDKQIILKSQSEQNQDEEDNIENNSNEETEEERLQKMTERDRMEYYFSKFISYIHEEDYTKAYELLYPEFRQRYFKTQEEFRDYVIKLYPDSVGFSYNDIERQGSIYVLSITVIDTDKMIGEEKSQRIVIQEEDINKFVLSFQVL